MKYGNIIISAVALISLSSCGGSFNKLLKSQDDDAKYKQALNYYYQRDYRRASTLFENITPNTPGSVREDTVIFYLGNSYYNTKSYELAAEMMNLYRTRFPRATFTEDAEYLYAMSYYNTTMEAERDQTNSGLAIVAFNEFLNRHPESDKKADIQVMIEELTQRKYVKLFINTSQYYKLGYFDAAITAMRNTLKDYPEMPQREEMMYLICKSWYSYARKSVPGRQLDRYLRMIDSYYNFKSEYPEGSRYEKELQDMFEYSQEFASRNGTQARELEQYILGMEERRNKIEENKNLIFETNDPAVRDRLRKEIKTERSALKVDRKKVNTEKKILKENSRQNKPKKENKKIKKESVSFEELEQQGAEKYIEIEKEQSVKEQTEEVQK